MEAERLETLLDLEARHEDLLVRLDDLDRKVEKVLSDWLPKRVAVEGSAAAVESA
jgi:hypothetical protein